MSRDYNKEFKDNSQRKYQYEIDIFVREVFLERVREFFVKTKDSKTMEVGSFDGSMTNLLLQYFENIDIVEPSSELVEKIKDRFKERVTVYHATIETFQTHRKYDNVFLIHTLEHLEDPIEVLKKLGDMLTCQGNIFIMVPNAGALSRRIAAKMGLMKETTDVIESERIQGHLRTYNLETLSMDINRAGLRLREVGGVLVKPLANYQLDLAFDAGIIGKDFLLACEALAVELPDLCSSIMAVASRE